MSVEMPTTAIVTAVLSLPLEARRALAAQPGPGWWYQPTGRAEWSVREHPMLTVAGTPYLLSVGWAWLPDNPLSWLRAACPPDGAWGVDFDLSRVRVETAWIECPEAEPGETVRLVTAPTTQECALRWWGVRL